MPTQDELAQQLIALVRETTAPEAVLLERRINATLAYLHAVTTPNLHTLQHVRWYLTGVYDRELEYWNNRFNEQQQQETRP